MSVRASDIDQSRSTESKHWFYLAVLVAVAAILLALGFDIETILGKYIW